MVNAEKILEESARYQQFLAGGDTGLTEDELLRQERYHHALDMIIKYSFSSKIARDVHADKYGVSRRTIDSDFIIAYQLLGKQGIFNKESNKNWLIYKCMKAIELCFNQNELKIIPKLIHNFYLLSELNKTDVNLPDFSNFDLPRLQAKLHPEALEMRKDPKILEEMIREFLVSKNVEEAKVVE